MARYKKIYRDEQHERNQKRERIQKTVDVCLALFWIATIVVLGIFQNNDTILGIGLIATGIVNGGYACFAFWALKYWKVMTVYDSDELYRSKYLFSRKEIEKEAQGIKETRTIVTAIVAITAIVSPVIGIGRLLNLW